MSRSREYGGAVVDSTDGERTIQKRVSLPEEEYPTPRYIGDTPEDELINEGLLPSDEIFDHHSDLMRHLIGSEPRDEPETVTFRINNCRNRKSK